MTVRSRPCVGVEQEVLWPSYAACQMLQTIEEGASGCIGGVGSASAASTARSTALLQRDLVGQPEV